MAEVIATGSAVVGIIAAALHSVRLLCDDFQSIKSADETIKPITEDLESIVGILSSLEQAIKGNSEAQETPPEIYAENIKTAASNCNKICTDFRTKLKKWIKHSNSTGKMDWRDRLRVGFWAEKDVLEFWRQLVACKGTFTIALQMKLISSSSRHERKIEAMVESLEKTEEGINQTGALVISRINEISSQLERLTPADTQLPTEETKQVESGPTQRELLTVFEDTLNDARSEVARRIKIGKVTEGVDGRALVGVHGLNNEDRMNVDIDDVNVGDRSKAAVGVTRGLDLKAFFN